MSINSPFLALPAELRLQIYAHVFSMPSAAEEEDRACSIGGNGCPRGKNKARRQEAYPAGEVRIVISSSITTRHCDHAGSIVGQKNFTSILRTCRLVHKEATGVLYQQTLFRISLGARGTESVDTASGKLRINHPQPKRAGNDDDRRRNLQDLSLFDRMQHVHLDLNFGSQINPIWDALPVIRALALTLNPDRKSTTASLRFGVATAITVSRLLDAPWEKFLQQLGDIELGCRPDVEVDEDAEKWVQFRRGRFEELRGVVRGREVRFVRFEERLGAHEEGLRACVVM